jgi:6-pyruvoyltetrahydropterin/6-carboxytetrahydropterin synthase
MMNQTYLNLAKQNFKFSSAHFLIFDDQKAEMLHGHNYQVEIKVYPKSDYKMDETGYFIDFALVKSKVKALCDAWDEHILLPEQHKDMKYKLSSDQKNYEINFRDRFYSFPKVETIWLPVKNTSVEQLSRLFAAGLQRELKSFPIGRLEVTIEETRGQSATTVFSTLSNS